MENTVKEGNVNKTPAVYDHYIVAIGASAGGLEAIHEFFDNMPANPNFSFIIIQHLSPDYKSLLVELVSKHTHMKVFEAEDKLTIQKECVYVIPNNKLMTIYNGRLRLVEKVQDKLPNTAIDYFLHSLAQEKKEKAIAIILSGTGSDGTRGIQAIKDCGGLVVVQDPVTARFDGMPNSAISSGNADMILPPEMIPEEIYNHINESPVLVLNKGKVDDRLLDEIFNLIHSAHGYDFHYYKTPTIIRRIGKRMGQQNIKKLEDYVAILRENQEEVKNLSKDFLIGVTRFFRDTGAFEALSNQVLPDMINAKNDGEVLKIWICACSTGEEAYSLAILIDQYLLRFRKMLEVKVFATDIDENSIEYAARNQYPLSIEKDIQPDVLSKYFVKEDKCYSIIPRIRKQIVFARHNVIKDPPFIKNDLVSCRNMLIYMNSILQQKVMNTLHFSLNTGGYLFLGTSETASSIKDSIDEVNSKWKIYRKIGKNRIPPFEIYRQLDNREAPKSSNLKRHTTKKNNQLAEDLTEAILDDFGYACFYIDKNYEIKESVGNFSRFLSLPDKKLNLNILKMVPQEISVALNTAIRKSWKEDIKVFLKSVRVKQDNTDLFLSISVRPAQPLSGKPYTLVVLGENTLSQIVVRDQTHIFPSESQNDYIIELEAELNETRSNLQMAVESLETTNEELQSSNEELLSANEELQSSNEELQSLNEELHTLNTEHQLKIKELIELNDDLNNYFRSTDIGQIFIDKHQNIRKFNTAALKLVNLIDSDIGRPINHISTNIRYENLMRDIEHVAKTEEVVEREIILHNESRYLMRIMPYIRLDKKNDGFILSFVDISAITNLNNIINGVFNSSLSAIMAFKAVRNYNSRIEDFTLQTCNYASDLLLDGSAISHQGKHLTEITSLADDVFFKKCIEVVEKGSPMHSEISHNEKWYEVVAVKMMDGFVATFTDITQEREAEQRLRQNYNELITARESLKKLNLQLEDKVNERTKALSQSEERFRLVSNATNDAIWDWNLVNNTVWWSDSFHSLFGYDSSDGTSNSNFWIENIHPDDRQRVKDGISAVINGDDSNQWHCEYQFRRKDGTYAHVLDRGYIQLDEYGTAYRMLGSMLDITELKIAQQQIVKSESRFRKVYESNMIGMLFTNKDGVIINANEAFLGMSGYSHEDLAENRITWAAITPPEYREANRLASEQIWANGVCPPFEAEYYRKDGSTMNVLLGAAAVSEDDAVAVTYIIDISQKKEAERKEQELQRIIMKQQNEFRGIFMNAPALISIRRGKDLRIEFVNQALIDYFGDRNLEGKTTNDLVNEFNLDNAHADEIMHRVYQTGVPYIGKALHLRLDREASGNQEDAWFDLLFQPVFNEAGIVDGVASFAYDVSYMIRANEELKKSEARFRFLAEVIPQKVWTASPDGVANYFNKVWLDYTGKEAEDLVGYNWLSVVHPDDRDLNIDLWNAAIKHGTLFEMERRLLSAEGEYRWHLSRCVPQKDERGNITIWVGASTDINDQKEISEALKESEDYFRKLADQSPFMIWKIDDDGSCNYVNKQWINFTGFSFEASMGLGWRKAFHPDDADRENKKFMKAFSSREIYQSKFRIRSTKNEYHWVLAQANPVLGKEFEGYIGSLTDITEQELAQQATKLLMQKKDEFMSIASHELKTPITSMKASLQIAERLSTRNVEAEKIQGFIEKANKQVNRLTSLVEDLLDVTKIQAGKMQFESERFFIDEAIRNSAEQMQNDSVKHQIIIQGEKEVPVWGDVHRVEQVIINFLSNAIKYSPEADKVLVNIKCEGKEVKVFVTDYGIGIPEDKINFVFDRFFRVQESSQKFSGLGLGLFISAEIIKRHSGNTGVYSEEGEGSTFWFTLPVAE